MTLQEKVNQLLIPALVDLSVVLPEYANTSLGALYLPSSNITATNEMQRYLITNSRLGIPVEWVQEALHGGAAGGTIFPMPVGMSSTWNVGMFRLKRSSCMVNHLRLIRVIAALIEKVHEVIALEARIVGAYRTFSPNMNLYTDPRFGRYETFAHVAFILGLWT